MKLLRPKSKHQVAPLLLSRAPPTAVHLPRVNHHVGQHEFVCHSAVFPTNRLVQDQKMHFAAQHPSLPVTQNEGCMRSCPQTKMALVAPQSIFVSNLHFLHVSGQHHPTTHCQESDQPIWLSVVQVSFYPTQMDPPMRCVVHLAHAD